MICGRAYIENPNALLLSSDFAAQLLNCLVEINQDRRCDFSRRCCRRTINLVLCFHFQAQKRCNSACIPSCRPLPLGTHVRSPSGKGVITSGSRMETAQS